MSPIEPEPSQWSLRFDPAHPSDLVAVGADLEPGTLLAAYRSGLFPMGTGRDGGPPMGWWSPVDRGVLLPGEHHVSRSLRRSRRHFTTSIDRDFDAVVRACADPGRDGQWITARMIAAYRRLYDLGWAHSVEVWDEHGELAGGLYGVAIGALFAGESMFHRATDAGKVAVWVLAEQVLAGGAPGLIDVQWHTTHLGTLGVREIDRAAYLGLLGPAVTGTLPSVFAGASRG
ncbi:leucyl/phenylalanyl-tRNA--protein transferase [Allobranchiibius sp. GilTou38]|uniref:leucyl/phenylalanyl-tRNA--protein transferase n=1 Tax=Allobranchiibius sp. GilTou38 TaxID=2815210 RepID=UPI0032609B1C